MPMGSSWAKALRLNTSSAPARMRSLNDDIMNLLCDPAKNLRPPGKPVLIALQGISRFQRELAIYFEDVDAAIDGIHVHQAHGSGSGFHGLQKLIFRAGNDHSGLVRSQQCLKLIGLHVI